MGLKYLGIYYNGVFTSAEQHWLRGLCLVINTFWLLNTVLPETAKCLTMTVHQNQHNSNHEFWENALSFKELLDTYVPSPPHLKQWCWCHGQQSNPVCFTYVNHGSANFPKILEPPQSPKGGVRHFECWSPANIWGSTVQDSWICAHHVGTKFTSNSR